MEKFEDLEAWQVSMNLVEKIYEVTEKFPKTEQYGIASQMRRAAVSITANIAEGFCRYTFADKANRYIIARGESGELRSLIHVAVRVKLLNPVEAQFLYDLVNRSGKLLTGLIRSCRVQLTR